MALQRGEGRSIGPIPGASSAIQGAHEVTVHNSTFNVVGGDSHVNTHTHSHTHHYYASSNKDLQALLDAIPNFRQIQQDTLARATPGTIVWLFKCKEFELFIDVDGILKILWGSGMPGAGKTVLAAIVIAKLEELAKASNGDICVGYVYIRYSDQARVNIRSILETLVKQTVEWHPDCMPLCEDAYRQHVKEGTRPSEEELVTLLRQFIAKRKATFYILDALDEAPTRVQLKILQALSLLEARLFITSRPLPGLEAKFPAAHTFAIRAQDHDLDLHIMQKISESQELQDLVGESGHEFEQRLVSTIKAKCEGMFLHATLQLEALQDCFTAHDAMRALEALPNTIEGLYQQTWNRIVDPGNPPHQRSLAMRALTWVLYAKRSLTVEELRRALATCPQTYHYNEARLMSEATILTSCRGLIVADNASKLVRLVHYTANAPLKNLLRKDDPHPESQLAAVCIMRLADCGFQDLSSGTYDAFDGALSEDPLLDYAHGTWASHVHASILADESLAGLASAFIIGCSAFPVAFPEGFSFWKPELLKPLHIVAYYNFPTVLAGPDATRDPNIHTSVRGLTPLHIACAMGHLAIAQAIISLPNICINKSDMHGQTPLISVTPWVLINR